MKRAFLLTFFAPLLALITLSSGCGKKEVDTDDDRPSDKFKASGTKGAATAASRTPLKAPLDGIIKGRVVLQGDRPVVGVIDKMATHNDHAGCLAGEDFEKLDQKWLIGKDNGVANVVISLRAPAGKYFEIKDEDKKLTGKKVVLDQPHCAFVPHVIAAFPSFFDGKGLQPTGEEFLVKNSAPFNHNTNWKGDPLKTGGGNRTLKQGETLPINLIPEPDPIQVSCDIHPWMYARVWAFDHPYFAVTKADGTFEIKDVPTGVEVGLVAWHEVPGFFHGDKKNGVKQKFNPGENKLEDLKISAK